MTIEKLLAHFETGDRIVFRKADLRAVAKLVRAADKIARDQVIILYNYQRDRNEFLFESLDEYNELRYGK